MASNFQVNKTDLDNIFKLKHPQTTKRADVGYQANTVDISNYYEPSTDANDRIKFNTDMLSSSTDLSQLFKSKSYTQLAVNIYAYRESKSKYRRNNDGSIYVYVNTTNAKQNINGSYDFKVTIATTVYNTSVGANEPLGLKQIASRFKLDSVSYGVTVTDINSSLSISTIVSVPYDSPTYNFYSLSSAN